MQLPLFGICGRLEHSVGKLALRSSAGRLGPKPWLQMMSLGRSARGAWSCYSNWAVPFDFLHGRLLSPQEDKQKRHDSDDTEDLWLGLKVLFCLNAIYEKCSCPQGTAKEQLKQILKEMIKCQVTASMYVLDIHVPSVLQSVFM